MKPSLNVVRRPCDAHETSEAAQRSPTQFSEEPFSFEPVGIDHDVALRWHIQASGRSYDFEIRLTGSETGGTSTKHHYFFGETSFERINLDIHYTFLQGFDPFILRSDGQGPTASIIGSPVLVPTGSVSPNANQTLDLYPTTLE